jgi:hypothetical protein
MTSIGEKPIKIEYDIPISKTTKGLKYPFNEMRTGSSFFAPVETDSLDMVLVKKEVKRLANAIRTASVRYSKDNPAFVFTIREQPFGVRVWRIVSDKPIVKEKTNVRRNKKNT